MTRFRCALLWLAVALGVAMGSAGCVGTHSDDGLTFDGRSYVLVGFLYEAKASLTRVEPIGTADRADPPWATDRTVYRVADIDPALVILVRVDTTRWDASAGSAAPALAAFASVEADLSQPDVSELLADSLPSPAPDRLAALDAAERQWATNGWATYRFTIELTWLVAPDWRGPFTFFVRDGRPYEAFRGKDPLSLEDKTLLEVPRTVPELFADVRRLVGSDVFDISFDVRLGYPVELRVDIDKGAIDDEGGWIVSDLEVLTPTP